jgi:hypothetical protein
MACLEPILAMGFTSIHLVNLSITTSRWVEPLGTKRGWVPWLPCLLDSAERSMGAYNEFTHSAQGHTRRPIAETV